LLNGMLAHDRLLDLVENFILFDESKAGATRSLDEEQKRAAKEGLSEDELALFDLLQKDGLDKSARERVKQASKELLASIKARLEQLDRFWEKEQTKADIEVFILDEIFAGLPTPPFSVEEKELLAKNVYAHVWQQAVRGDFSAAA
jgi:type I restriction enzyme, R subunit